MISPDLACLRSAAVTVALCAMLASCAALTTPYLTSDQQHTLTTNLKEKYATYQKCMVAESDRFSHIDSAPPSDIAQGAQAGCDGAYQGYQRAVAEQFAAVVSSTGKEAAQKRAEQHAAAAAARTRRQIIRRVLIQRQ